MCERERMAEEDRLVERFTERPAERQARIAAKKIDPATARTMMAALGLEGTDYGIFPAPLANPQGDLMGAWVVRMGGRRGRIVARFNFDGRDRAEEWLRIQRRDADRRAERDRAAARGTR